MPFIVFPAGEATRCIKRVFVRSVDNVVIVLPVFALHWIAVNGHSIVLYYCWLIRNHWQLIYVWRNAPLTYAVLMLIISIVLLIISIVGANMPHGATQLLVAQREGTSMLASILAVSWPLPRLRFLLGLAPLQANGTLATLSGRLPFGHRCRRGSKQISYVRIALRDANFTAAAAARFAALLNLHTWL